MLACSCFCVVGNAGLILPAIILFFCVSVPVKSVVFWGTTVLCFKSLSLHLKLLSVEEDLCIQISFLVFKQSHIHSPTAYLFSCWGIIALYLTWHLLWFLPASRYSSRTEVITFCEKRITGIELSGDGIVRSLVWKVLASLVKHNGVWNESRLPVWSFKCEQIDLFSCFRSLNLGHAHQESMDLFFYTQLSEKITIL